MQQYLAFALLAYLIGCLPTGAFFARFKKGKSLLEPGTRSTKRPQDVFEILGIPLGIFVSILDILKGILVVRFLTTAFFGPTGIQTWWIVAVGGLLVVIGHCNSALLGFKGGRGLAPTFGALVSIFPVPAILSALLGAWLAFWGLSTKPGALSAAGVMPILSIAWVTWFRPEEPYYLFVVAFMSLWTMWEYRDELNNYLGLSDSNKNVPPPTISPQETEGEEEKIEQ